MTQLQTIDTDITIARRVWAALEEGADATRDELAVEAMTTPEAVNVALCYLRDAGIVDAGGVLLRGFRAMRY